MNTYQKIKHGLKNLGYATLFATTLAGMGCASQNETPNVNGTYNNLHTKVVPFGSGYQVTVAETPIGDTNERVIGRDVDGKNGIDEINIRKVPVDSPLRKFANPDSLEKIAQELINQ